MSRNVSVDAGFLCNEAAVHGDTINGTPHICSVCRRGLESTGLGHNPSVGCCGHGNEPSRFLKGWEFIEWLSDCKLLKKQAGSCSELLP
jgi:hypothetical protein